MVHGCQETCAPQMQSGGEFHEHSELHREVSNSFTISKGSSDARIFRNTSLASTSGLRRICAMSLCSCSTSARRASCFRRADVKRVVSGSTSYSQETPFVAQRMHEGRLPSHCHSVSFHSLFGPILSCIKAQFTLALCVWQVLHAIVTWVLLRRSIDGCNESRGRGPG